MSDLNNTILKTNDNFMAINEFDHPIKFIKSNKNNNQMSKSDADRASDLD